MEIVCIFAPGLFAIQYPNTKENELARLIKLWNDPIYLEQWLWENQNDFSSKDLDALANGLIDDALTMEEMLLEAMETGLDAIFRPLNNLVSAQLFISKEKLRKNYFRLYAIRVDSNLYIITGGAIKAPLVRKMQDRNYLNNELKKLTLVNDYLTGIGVVDKESFYEMMEEQY